MSARFDTNHRGEFMRRNVAIYVSVAAVSAAGFSGSTVAKSGAATPSSATAQGSFTLTLLAPTQNDVLKRQLLAAGTVISPARYQQLFGSTAASMTALKSWATARHFTIRASSQTSGEVSITASAELVASALHVRVIKIKRGKSAGLAVLGSPRASTSAVLAIAGLNTTTRMHTMGALQPDSVRTSLTSGTGSTACAPHWGDHLYPSALKYSAESNQVCGYTPSDLTKMYSASSLQKNSPNLGIILWGDDPNILTLTNQYMAQINYPPLTKYNKFITTPDPDMSSCDPQDAQAQQAVDVQASHALSPLSAITYYGASSCDAAAVQASFQKAVDDHRVTSLVLPTTALAETDFTPADITAWNRTAQQAALTGISVFAASGDYGNSSSVDTDGLPHTTFPASSPYLTAVGGTAVGMRADGSQPVVAGWEDRTFSQTDPTISSFTDVTSYISGAGGGVSQISAQPTWQKGISSASSTKRLVPDVSALADPYTGFSTRYTAYDDSGTPYETYGTWGGTSLAATVVATVSALAKTADGVQIGNFAGWLYTLRASNSISDVNNPNAAGAYYASPYGGGYVIGFDSKPETLMTAKGWDPVTGLGTINAANMATALKAAGAR